jgi:caffeoyl-CoA O-methyltransferase
MSRIFIVLVCAIAFGSVVFAKAARGPCPPLPEQLSVEAQKMLDVQVMTVLEAKRGAWHDLNVPDADGRALHDLIVKHGLTRALEIGTSTGHSGIWIGWALAKTGGTLITIDIDEGRHREAVRNFEEAGLTAFIDARLGDAHDLVPTLEGPFDFVFIDADKDWYVNYAKAVLPKLLPRAILTAHNVSGGVGRGRRGSQGADYHAFVTDLPGFDTTIVNGQLAVSVRRSPR